MRAEFWHERWERGETGFHQQEVNTYLKDWFHRIEAKKGSHILVPLCGKSLDLLWLAGCSYRVTGIEISAVAVMEFFTENKLDYEIDHRTDSPVYRSAAIEIHCTDFFRTGRQDLSRIDAVYDRASLVALPPEMRPAYAKHLSSLLDDGVRMLLITMQYPQGEMRGPPFSVTPEEVEQLFGDDFSIEQVHSEDCLEREPRFRKKGLTSMDENVFVLTKKRSPVLSG